MSGIIIPDNQSLNKKIGTVTNLVGSSTISSTGKNTVTEAIGNTSIAGIGDGTLSGAISSLNTSLYILQTLSFTLNVQDGGYIRTNTINRSNHILISYANNNSEWVLIPWYDNFGWLMFSVRDFNTWDKAPNNTEINATIYYYYK